MYSIPSLTKISNIVKKTFCKKMKIQRNLPDFLSLLVGIRKVGVCIFNKNVNKTSFDKEIDECDDKHTKKSNQVKISEHELNFKKFINQKTKPNLIQSEIPVTRTSRLFEYSSIKKLI